MKKIVPALFSLFLLFSCSSEKQKELTQEQLDMEKDAVVKVINAYLTAYESKNFSPIVDLLSKDVKFFGTDSAETIKSIIEYKEKINKEWQLYEKITYGSVVDMSVYMDKHANLASVIFGLPCTLVKNGEIEQLFLRYARTLRKEDGKWVIISGIVGSTTKGQSSEELLEQKIRH